jgi:hypothetical protein
MPVPQASLLPQGVDALPDGVVLCKIADDHGYAGNATCHTHDGTDSSMKTALAAAQKDAKVDVSGATVRANARTQRNYSDEPFVDLAAASGRISIDDLEVWERAFEDDPARAARELVTLPENSDIARLNAAGESLDTHYRAEAGSRLGLPKEAIL